MAGEDDTRATSQLNAFIESFNLTGSKKGELATWLENEAPREWIEIAGLIQPGETLEEVWPRLPDRLRVFLFTTALDDLADSEAGA